MAGFILLAAIALLLIASPTWAARELLDNGGDGTHRTVNVNSNGITFAVIGDWGRLNAYKSLQPVWAGGFAQNSSAYYRPASAPINANATYPGGYENTTCPWSVYGGDDEGKGAEYQNATAQAMNDICSDPDNSCNAVINVGDSFYDCGLDDPSRWVTDWQDVYQTGKPGTKDLKWYSILGNHDVPGNSAQLEINYSQQNSKWVLPARYYAIDFQAKGFKVTAVFINTSPFVSSYNKTTNKYFGPEIQATNTIAAITAQLNFLEQTLNSSDADQLVVIGHHPVFGASSGINGPAQYANIAPGVTVDQGMPCLESDGVTPTNAWVRLVQILRDQKVSAYFNGHDHALSWVVDPESVKAGNNPADYPTNFFTSGAGSLTSVGDTCQYPISPNVNYAASTFVSHAPTNPCGKSPALDGWANPGFMIASFTKCELTVQIYPTNLDLSTAQTAFSATKGNYVVKSTNAYPQPEIPNAIPTTHLTETVIIPTGRKGCN